MERTTSPRLFLLEGYRVAVFGPGARGWVLNPADMGGTAWRELSREAAVDMSLEAHEIPPSERKMFIERAKSTFDAELLITWDKISDQSSDTSTEA